MVEAEGVPDLLADYVQPLLGVVVGVRGGGTEIRIVHLHGSLHDVPSARHPDGGYTEPTPVAIAGVAHLDTPRGGRAALLLAEVVAGSDGCGKDAALLRIRGRGPFGGDRAEVGPQFGGGEIVAEF